MKNGIYAIGEARVGNDPELREVSGATVCNLSLAVTERKQNKQTNSWEDGTTTWLRAAVWGPMANNVAASIMKGQLVDFTGILSERKYTTDQGAERSQLELRVESISPSLRFAQAQVIPNDRNGGGGQQAQPQQQWSPSAPQQAPWQQQAPQPPQQQPMQQQPAQQVYRGPQQQPAPAQQQPPQQQQQPPRGNQQWATPAYATADDAPF